MYPYTSGKVKKNPDSQKIKRVGRVYPTPHERWDLDLNRYSRSVDTSNTDDTTTSLLYTPDVGRGINFQIPTVSLTPFAQDLTGDYSSLSKSGVPHIDAIIDGHGKLLGKGNDGIVYQVLGDTVKISTTIPFHPTQQPHRTPKQAREHTRREADVLRGLEGEIPCVLPIEYVEHEERGWIIKPFLELRDYDSQVAQEQYNQLEDCIVGLHKAGYVLGDTLQWGVGRDGNPYFLDLGQATALTPDLQRDDEQSVKAIAIRNKLKMHKFTSFIYLFPEWEKERDRLSDYSDFFEDNEVPIEIDPLLEEEWQEFTDFTERLYEIAPRSRRAKMQKEYRNLKNILTS